MIQDDAIIEMFFERSEDAIRELDTKYGKACFKLSYNIVNNSNDKWTIGLPGSTLYSSKSFINGHHSLFLSTAHADFG